MKTKLVNLYDQISKVFTGTYLAQESPTDPSKYMMPSNSTDIALPALEKNQTCLFTNDSWEVIPDFRGQKWYDKSTGDEVLIESAGQPSDNLIPTLPDFILLEQAKIAKLQQIQQTYSTSLATGVSFTTVANITKNFQTYSSSISSMQYTATAISNGWVIPSGFYWVSSDNTQVPFTADDLNGLLKAATDFNWSLFQTLQTNKNLVKIATTLDEVNAI